MFADSLPTSHDEFDTIFQVFTCPDLQMCSLQKAPGKAKRPSNSSHFDPKRKQTLEKHGLEIWPGYVSVIGHYEG